MKKIFKNMKKSTKSYIVIILAYAIIQALWKTVGISSLIKNLLVPVCCYIVCAIGLNLVVGFSGELSLGQAGFMSIGAFSAVITNGILNFYIESDTIRLIICIILGGIIAGMIGFLIGIPVLKLNGDYLAIVTLAFGEIIKSIINNIYLGYDKDGLHFSFIEKTFELAKKGKYLISGPLGATGTKEIATFSGAVILILICLFIVNNLLDSKYGRDIIASRDNRIAATSIGINVTSSKMLAFVLSAVLAGFAGALYAMNYTTLTPAKFDYNQSILILVYVVLGGLGNINGTMISTVALVILPELLRELKDFRMLIYSVVLIVVMLVTNNAQIRYTYERIINKLKGGKRNG